MSPEHSTQNHNWLTRTIAQHPALAVVLLIASLYLPAIAGGGYVVNCMVDYQRDLSNAIIRRNDTAQKVDAARAAFEDVNAKILSQNATIKDYEKARRLARELDRLEDEQTRTEENNPLPEFPERLCGLRISGE